MSSAPRSYSVGDFLAQVGYSVSCTDTFDRFEENPDVASVLSSTAKWTDNSFAKDEAMYGENNAFEWTRMQDAFPAAEGYSLFANN